MKNASRIAWALAIMLGAGTSGAWADENDVPPSGKLEQLGRVSFPVSCKPAAQKEFSRAVAVLHSFYYQEAVKSFARVVDLDPPQVDELVEAVQIQLQARELRQPLEQRPGGRRVRG